MRILRKCSRLLAAFTSLTLLCGAAALPSAAQSPALTLERTVFAQGEDIAVQYTGSSGKDWIAVYKKGDEPGSDGPPSLVYEYTSKTGQPDGTMDFKDTDRGNIRELELGEYDMYLLRDDGYDVLAKASFTVTPAASSATLTMEQTTFAQGEDIAVQYTGSSGKDWIAIYQKGNQPGDGNPPALVYEYTSKTGQPDGTMDFKDTDRGNIQDLEPGEYDVYLLKNDGYEVLGKASFAVTQAAQSSTLTMEHKEFTQGEDITARYTGASGKDRIAVYKQGDTPGDAAVLVYEYTSKTGQPDGTMDFKDTETGDVKDLEPGEYGMYLLKDDGFEILAKTSFSVKAAAPPVSDPAISTDKAVYEVGETPVFSYTGSSHPDAWIGVYSSESKTPQNGNPALVWKYTREIRQPDGSTNLKNAEGDSAIDQLPVGDYYVYLFADGGYTIVATATFTVTLTPRDPATCPAPLAVYYDRTASQRGYADGSVSIRPPRGVEGLTGYRLYWGNENGPLEDYTEIPVQAAETGLTVREMNANTMIPYGATRLYAFAVYEDNFQSPDSVYTELPEGAAAEEEEPLWSFQVFSDTHIQTDPNHLHNRHLRMALTDILKTDPDSAAIFTVGDTTDNGELGQYQQYSEIVNSFTGLPFIYSTPGNHDLRNETYQQAIDRFSQHTKAPNKYYAEKVEGATFIMLGSQDLDNWDLDRSSAHLKDDQIAFLKAELEKAADGMQPIFVFLHQPLYNTVSGSLPGQNWHGVDRDAELREIFKEYPQVVFFTGHTHWELDAKSPMYAGNGLDATMFNDAAVGYLWTDEDTGKEGSQGYYVEVYADKLLVRGRDFVQGKWIPSAQFIVDISKNIKGLTARLSETGQELAAKKGQIQALLENIQSLPAGRRDEYQAEEQKLSALMKAIAEEENPSPAVPGDMDGDGEVTIQDVMEACKVLARQSAGTQPTEDEMQRGNLDGDDKFTITDVMEICKILARRV